MPPKVVVVGDVPDELTLGLQRLDFHDRIALVQVPRGLPETLAQSIRPHLTDGVVLILERPTQLRQPITAATVAGAAVGLVIISVSAGIDHIDTVEDGTRRVSLRGREDVLVVAAAVNEESVAELNVQLALALVRPLHLAREQLLRSDFSNIPFASSRLLKGATWLAIGPGKQVPFLIQRLSSFGLSRILVQHPAMDARRLQRCVGPDVPVRLVNESEPFAELPHSLLNVRGVRDLSSAVREADIVSLNVPLTPQTKQLINATLLENFKRGAFLINTARGEVVDEEAVCEAICGGRLGGYAADVIGLEAERRSEWERSPVWALHNQRTHNVVLSPHIGGTTVESMRDTSAYVLRLINERLDLPNASAGNL
jgi:phosphoglycerate dehydrogenase-like enzyme